MGRTRGEEEREGGDVMENSVICVGVRFGKCGVRGNTSLGYCDNLLTVRLLLINNILHGRRERVNNVPIEVKVWVAMVTLSLADH